MAFHSNYPVPIQVVYVTSITGRVRTVSIFKSFMNNLFLFYSHKNFSSGFGEEKTDVVQRLWVSVHLG